MESQAVRGRSAQPQREARRYSGGAQPQRAARGAPV